MNWEYHDKIGETIINFDINHKAAVKEIKLHGLKITDRELKNDTLTITYS